MKQATNWIAGLLLLVAAVVLLGHVETGAQSMDRRGFGPGPSTFPGTSAPGSVRRLRPLDPGDFYRRAPSDTIGIRQVNWGYRETAPPMELKVHDIVTILVDEKSEVTLNSRFDRQRNAEFTAALEEFVRFAGNANSIQNTAQTSPTIDVSQNQRVQSSGRSTDQEGIRYRIAATVVDVRPNGYLVLEARKSVRTNQDYWEYSLTGILRPDDVLPNNTALSENIANLDIVKNQRGRIYGSTRLNWGSKLIDMLWPF